MTIISFCILQCNFPTPLNVSGNKDTPKLPDNNKPHLIKAWLILWTELMRKKNIFKTLSFIKWFKSLRKWFVFFLCFFFTIQNSDIYKKYLGMGWFEAPFVRIFHGKSEKQAYQFLPAAWVIEGLNSAGSVSQEWSNYDAQLISKHLFSLKCQNISKAYKFSKSKVKPAYHHVSFKRTVYVQLLVICLLGCTRVIMLKRT